MNDRRKIVAGLVVFAVLFTSPLWWNLAGGAARSPKPKIVAQGVKCVAPRDYMRRSHMDLLHEWRDAVVRQGKRIYTADDGAKHQMSLSKGCLKCHSNKAEFCDQCHVYAGVKPNCWQCHAEPKESTE